MFTALLSPHARSDLQTQARILCVRSIKSSWGEGWYPCVLEEAVGREAPAIFRTPSRRGGGQGWGHRNDLTLAHSLASSPSGLGDQLSPLLSRAGHGDGQVTDGAEGTQAPGRNRCGDTGSSPHGLLTSRAGAWEPAVLPMSVGEIGATCPEWVLSTPIDCPRPPPHTDLENDRCLRSERGDHGAPPKKSGPDFICWGST